MLQKTYKLQTVKNNVDLTGEVIEEEIDVLEEVTIPDLEEHVDSVSISFWHIDAGDLLEAGDDLVDIIVKKRIVTIKASSSGMLNEIFFEEGDEALIDEVLATIEPEK